jgi:hypothetical protein
MEIYTGEILNLLPQSMDCVIAFSKTNVRKKFPFYKADAKFYLIENVNLDDKYKWVREESYKTENYSNLKGFHANEFVIFARVDSNNLSYKLLVEDPALEVRIKNFLNNLN